MQPRILATGLLVAATLFACNKNDDTTAETPAQQLQLSMEAAMSEDAAAVVYDDVFDNVMGSDAEAGLGMNIGVFGGRSSATGKSDSTNPGQRCFTVMVSPAQPGVFPRTVTLDFGTTGCTGRDGKVRKGKMITVFSGPMRQPQSVATTTFQNFYSDSFQVEGTHIITNTGTATTRSFRTQVQNGKLSKSSTQFITWNKDITWVQTEGLATPNLPLDDAFSFTGSAGGSRVNGAQTNAWTMQIGSPLLRRFSCRWVVQGVRNITRNNVAASMDYGTGNCDNQAVLTINGQTRTITLP